jgi:hypothetical protein
MEGKHADGTPVTFKFFEWSVTQWDRGLDASGSWCDRVHLVGRGKFAGHSLARGSRQGVFTNAEDMACLKESFRKSKERAVLCKSR